ncbi:hypothetical protein [Streptomyces sp. NPDC007883]|uniref:hypothetical protein n=1 Tax=Streptomyces sp. NPDC007883 TaxID=3155116 RepID=UPI0033F5EA26
MINLEFSVRPNQGDPSGFDLGDITVSGDGGSVDSRGHTPDQGMMIYLTVALLLNNLAGMIKDGHKSLNFIGVDTSFGIEFHRNKRGISVSSSGKKIANSNPRELTAEILRAAEKLAESDLSRIAENDAPKSDYIDALTNFRTLAASTQGS